MQVLDTPLAGLKIIETPVFHDARGYFTETFRCGDYGRALGEDVRFVQDNRSVSHANVLRGMHFQRQQPQGKLVEVCAGRVFDVAVDLRRSSATFGRWHGLVLEAPGMPGSAGAASRRLWIPPGFAHGFYALSDTAMVSYKCTAYFDPGSEACLRWDDPEVGIEWPLAAASEAPILSSKDSGGLPLQELKAREWLP